MVDAAATPATSPRDNAAATNTAPDATTSLSGANVSTANVGRANLGRANLGRANLGWANLGCIPMLQATCQAMAPANPAGSTAIPSPNIPRRVAHTAQDMTAAATARVDPVRRNPATTSNPASRSAMNAGARDTSASNPETCTSFGTSRTFEPRP